MVGIPLEGAGQLYKMGPRRPSVHETPNFWRHRGPLALHLLVLLDPEPL